jgi:hypothetical protein
MFLVTFRFCLDKSLSTTFSASSFGHASVVAQLHSSNKNDTSLSIDERKDSNSSAPQTGNTSPTTSFSPDSTKLPTHHWDPPVHHHHHHHHHQQYTHFLEF